MRRANTVDGRTKLERIVVRVLKHANFVTTHHKGAVRLVAHCQGRVALLAAHIGHHRRHVVDLSGGLDALLLFFVHRIKLRFNRVHITFVLTESGRVPRTQKRALMRLTLVICHGHVLLICLLQVLLLGTRRLAPLFFVQRLPQQVRERFLECMVRSLLAKAQEPRVYMPLLVIIVPHGTQVLERKIHVHARVHALTQPRRLGSIHDHPVQKATDLCHLGRHMLLLSHKESARLVVQVQVGRGR